MHTTSFGSFSGPVELPLPSGYLSTGDPIMAVNPYTVGIAPRRMYCSGLAFNDHPYDTPSSIVVWHSDDGGQSWSPGAVVIATAGGGYALDKPAMTVSWYSGTLGYVYITYIMLDRNTNFNSSSIWVARSTDGGNTFPVKTLISYDNVQFPQVVVDSNGGTIYAIWANRTYGDLRMSQSADAGVSFGAHDIVAGGNLINGSQLNGSIRANSIPMARFNWAAGRVCIVYYAWGAAGPNTDTDVYYTFKPGCTNCNAYGWQDPIRVNDVATRDQFMPGIDFNSSGNVIVTFYDRRNDSANLLYDEYAAYLTSTGVPVGNQPNLLLSAFASNPISAGVTPWPGFIGDYQDVWDDAYPEGESATAAWIGIPFASDDYLSRIFY